MFWFLLLMAMFTAGCLGSDEICPDGYEYNRHLGVCVGVATDDGGSSNPAGDAGSGGFDGGGPNGMGEPCVDDSDCETYEADTCALNPMIPGEGYCTVVDCTPGQCAPGFQCCDCTGSDMVPAETVVKLCLKDAEAEMSSFVGCGCE